jgi:hypothetical protein
VILLKNFFSRPYEFSFKDLLAAVFCGVFLYFGWQALKSESALAVVQTLVPLLGIILGGYFVQESATIWLNRSQERQVQSATDNRNKPPI